MTKNEATAAAAQSILIVRPDGPAAFGITPAERLAKQATRRKLAVAEAPDRADVIIRGDHVYGAGLVDALIAAPPGTVLVDTAGRALAARVDAAGRDWAMALLDRETPTGDLPAEAIATDPVALAGQHNIRLRKKLKPLLVPATDARTVEKALFDDSYKGVTDVVTKYVWPPLALPATRWCALRGITPNQVTTLSAVFVGLAFWLFMEGHFAIGIAVAWAMTLLDTIDGKLARVTLQSSPFGNIFDHGIDLIHPPFWWWAWAMGLTATGVGLDDGGLTVWIIVIFYVLQRGEEALFLQLFGMQIHIWQRFDSKFREITARRNPNLLILMAATAVGAPREGLVAVAVWTVLSFLIHLVRIFQAMAARRSGPLKSWLAEA